MATNAQRADIIRFWRAVELFSPPSVDKVSRERRVFAVTPGQPLPWEPGHELARIRLPRDQAWRHVVYVGVFSLESVFDVLSRVFTTDENSFEERPNGESALAAFLVSGDGRPLIGSRVLSSCAWATGRALRPGPGTRGWLSGFDEASEKFAAAFEDLMAADEDDAVAQRLRSRGHEVGHPIGADEVHGCREAAVAATGAEAVLAAGEIRIRSEVVAKRKAHGTDGHDFLNSFIVGDLATVSQQAGAGTIGTALREYLRPDSELDTTRRVDVRQCLDSVLRATAPAEVPLGRWPAKAEHPLALSQQLAVNSALRTPHGSAGILGVNGPPGTGKTTMLRDLVAAVVVERARRLAGLARPADAFTGRKPQWETGSWTRTVHEWKPEFTGFEIVVASANNGAVENVTHEIPAADAVDEAWRDAAAALDYFPGIASALLTADQDENDEPHHGGESTRPRAWGLVAARLGNKRNRGTFVDAFWYRKPDSLAQAANEAAQTQLLADLPEAERATCGLWALLKSYELSRPPCTWHEEVTRFRQALDRATTIQADRERAYTSLARRARAEAALNEAHHAHATARQQAEQMRAQVAEREQTAQAWADERKRCVGLRAEHRQFRPGFWEWLTTLGKAMRRWQQRDQELAAEVTAAEQALHTLRDELGRLSREAEQASRAATVAAEALQRCEHDLAAATADIDRARAELGTQFPDAEWWSDRERRELGALWTDPSWNEARSELFLAALRLHKAFLRHAPTQMRQSLHAVADILGGEAPGDLPAETARAAWQALFFVVPVVSTTFASVARLFSHLGREALGWLLVDEAGQATPQQAVGALWRCTRAVVVGDPLQLEPITTVPFRAEQAIRADHGVDEQWLTSRTSVQRLADRLTAFGTWLPHDDGDIWVGAPLTVHRRCDEPMFGIANDIAYDGLMINGTPQARAAEYAQRYPTLPASKWIDVASEHSQGHWVPAEGDQLDRILGALSRLDVDMSAVMVVAPFRDIARQVRRRARDYPGLVAGTIHTAQGREADIVVLVLGSDPQRPGARRWAAAKPNLLNVATSRARRRLYVIGDRRAWAGQRHFDILAGRLPHGRPQ